MKMRKLFAGIAAAATLLGGMALGATSAQADDAATTAGTAAIKVKNSQEGHTYAAYKFATLTVDTDNEGKSVQVGTDAAWEEAVQQARRIDELERANASLLDKLNKAIPSPTVDE